MKEIRYRQIHLDFHTSEFIPDVGRDFDSRRFAEKLAEASVDSITCFARCHHGWLYYPSEKHEDLVHPNLVNRNLLPEQIAACHSAGINVPVYTTVQWDGRIAREHPEWLSVGPDGGPINTQNVEEPHFYYTICLNSGYRRFFKDHLEDLIGVIGAENLDGLFMDILFPVDCCCENCRTEMLARGMDPGSRKQRMRYSVMMLDGFKKEITAFIKEKAGDIGIFYNSSHISPASRNSFEDYSHLEIESLPSGGWGYDHFPAVSRYARTLGKEMIGMTGKFHTYWGDFHSLKNRAALEFECFNMLAMGTGCSIGDQLHPSGRLSDATYELIGGVYAGVKAKEKYCRGAVSRAEIAVMNPEEFYSEDEYNLGISPSLVGAVRMLQELSHQFDIIDSTEDFSGYKLIILPDCISCGPEVERKLRQYAESGGRLLGSYDSCLSRGGEPSIFGVSFECESPFYRDFILPNDVVGKNLPKEEHVMYLRSHDVKAADAEVLMDKIRPYFDRSGDTFCSHQHAPSSGESCGPAVTRNRAGIYFSHPIFRLYRKNAAIWCKHIVADAVELLLGPSLIRHDGPSTVQTSLTRQEGAGRDVLHLLHYITEKRSEDIFTIEDVLPLHDLNIGMRTDGRSLRRLYTAPGEAELEYRSDGDYVSFTLDKLEGHAIVCAEYCD